MTARRKVFLSIIVGVCLSAAASAWFFLFTHQGAEVVLRAVLATMPRGLHVSYGHLQGDLAGGLVCPDAAVSGIGFLPAGTTVKADQARIAVSFSLPPGISIEAKNGKVELPDSRVVFFSGSYAAGRLNVNLFAPATSFAAVSVFMPRARIIKAVSGTIENFDIFISGPLHEPRFTGGFSVPQAALKHFAVKDLRCAVDLTLYPLKKKPLLFGHVAFGPATVILRRSAISVEPGKVIFNGIPERFVFAVRGVSKVQGTDIAVALSGTLDQPDFLLTSVPAFPQDKLLLMLLTGKSWEGTGEAAEKGALSTDVAKDFVDFLFLGGTGDTLSARLGVESVHLTYDATTQGIEIKKSLTDSTSVIYGIKEEKSDSVTETEPVQTQKVGLEYKLTDKLTIEGSQEFKNLVNATQQEESPPESTIQLKFKQSF